MIILPTLHASLAGMNPFRALSNGAFYWTSAEDTTSRVNGDPVSSISDLLYGTGRTATSTLTARPTWTTGGINSKAYLAFDGTDDVLNFSSSPTGTGDVSYTVFCIFNPTSTGSDEPVYSWGTAGTRTQAFLIARTTNQLTYGPAGDDLNISVTGGPFGKNLLAVTRYNSSGTSQKGDLFGAATGTGSKTLAAAMNFGSGAGSIGMRSSSYYNGNIYALAIVRSSVSDDQMTNCVNYWRSSALYGAFS